MNNIGIRYYSSNPHPPQRVEGGGKEDNMQETQCIGILEKAINVSEIDENVLKFIDVEYTDSATISINHISTKYECQKVIDLLEIIKNNIEK